MLTPPAILLTDDEEVFRVSTAELLRGEGHTCDEAVNADDALRRLVRRRYDLLIADIRMPGNHNLEFIEQAHKILPDLPVILVTGYPSTDTAISSIHLPVMAYLRKPIPFSELRASVEKALAVSRGWQVIARAKRDLELCANELGEIQRDRWDTPSPKTAQSGKLSGDLVHTLSRCMNDLAGLTEQGRSLKGSGNHPCVIADCPAWKAHQATIRQAITLLSETKRRFKSKELGQVRELLEGLLTCDSKERSAARTTAR